MLDYKSAAMSGERAKCRLVSIPADLADQAQRHAVFSAAGNSPALMITEGLLMYLSADVVEALATESLALSGIRHWLLDVTSPELDRQMDASSRDAMDKVRAGNHLNGVQIRDLQSRAGWISIRHRSYTRDFMEVAAARIQKVIEARGMALSELPPPPPNDPSGVYLMGRA
jgi:O-methyltransferase involved in polyketide biosynthesis